MSSTAPAILPFTAGREVFEIISRGLQAPDGLSLPPGEYPVRGRATIELDAVVSRAPDGEAHQPARIEPNKVIAALLVKLDVSPAKWVTVARQAVLDSHQRKSKKLTEATAVVTATVDQAKAELSESLPKVSRAGATKVAGRVELVAFDRT